jgi:hypothetical protein
MPALYPPSHPLLVPARLGMPTTGSSDWREILNLWPAITRPDLRPRDKASHLPGELRRMPRFYFHVHQDGRQSEDHKGRVVPDEQAACRQAFRDVAAVIGRIGRTNDQTGTYIGIEVSDGENTRCIVRAFIVVEHPR